MLALASSSSRTALSVARERVATQVAEVSAALYSNGPLSQRLQRHPPPQDRSQHRAGRSPRRDGVEGVSDSKNRHWSLRRQPVLPPRTAAFNLRLGQLVDIGRSLRLVETLKEMKELQLQPDILTYNSAMELFGKHGMEDEAWALVDDMKALGVMPDIETYKFLLQAVRYAPHEATWSVLRMMQGANVELNEGAYALLIQRYLDDSNLEMAFKLLVEMERRGLTPTLNTAEGIITLAARRRMPRLALELAENFEASSVRRLSMRVWVSCLLSSSECLYKEGVLHLWPKVTNELKVLPDEGCTVEVLHTAGRHGLPELAMDVLRVLKTIGADLKEYHFSPIIEAFCRTNRFKEALSTLTLIRQNNIEPTADTTHPIFEAIKINTDGIDAAWDALEALHADGQTVDITAVNVVIQASVALGDLQRAFGTYQMCAELGIKPTLDSYHFLLSGCIAARHRELGDRLIAEMKEANIKPDAGTYERLIVLCLAGETYEDAFFYLEEMKAENLHPPLSVYEAIIQRCIVEKDSRYAVAVQELKDLGYEISPALQRAISSEGEDGSGKNEQRRRRSEGFSTRQRQPRDH
ncbi:hypothetical protein B0F90DRAFT_1748918 [Multifurca ochricompacta]|uniref:Pentatricopeptide repeat-containing protein-mitochondrial domain-containing protein n=1 Tax=Multifurca ochricompacta TaxID=376703 RepID=A0AAD4QL59_9AGAM|nr:hypothetical protein B0F90DRAFT_1748918 [Multifurca ochricompacta]